MRWFCPAVLLAALVASVNVLAQSGPSAAAAYAAPKTRFGQPDLQGVWQVLNTAAWDIQDHAAQRFPGLQARFSVPAGPGVVEGNEIPYQPWALEQKQKNFANRLEGDPEAKCYLPGVPRIMYLPLPFQIVQVPTKMVMLFEYAHAIRHIHTNGNGHPPGHIDWWLGDSRGRWEGDTFVVDSVDFNDETWFDRAGNFHSDELHVVERFTPNGPDHIAYEVTIEDPKVFTRPWKMQMPIYRRKEANAQLLEYECYAFEWEKYYPYPGLW